MLVPSSYGVLSAKSANTIQGRAPTFSAQSGAKKLGFTLRGVYYSESEGNIKEGVVKLIDAGVSLSEFYIKQLTSSDFNISTDYYDADGDGAHPTSPFTMDSIRSEWRDRTGAIIPSSNYNQPFGCGNTKLKFPLTLKIELSNIKVRSRYGKPNESIPTNLTKTYKIAEGTGICFVKPGTLYFIPATPDNGGGYSSDFSPVNGFKANASLKFPTTGFPGAYFNLVMTSNATDFTYTSNAEPAVTVDANGKVTLNSKPAGEVTITAKYKNDPTQVHYYKFNPRNVWIVPQSTRMTRNNAITACGGLNKLPTRSQLTNGNTVLLGGCSSWRPGHVQRAIGGGVFSEWGGAAYGSALPYPDSLLINTRYWTQGIACSYSGTFGWVVTYNEGSPEPREEYYNEAVACVD
ncbi:hypothetical protein RCS94_07200 [Orbaceae bacterium ac157xtp]